MKSHKSVPVLVAAYILMMFTAPAFAAVIYVDADATSGANNGESWANAYVDLQDGLSAAASGDEIWVAAGTYYPGTNRTDSFVLQAGADIYGGFAGGEISRDQRNWKNNVTTLSGDIGAAGDNSDNSYHVVSSSGMSITSVLDGFTISGGNANGAFPDYESGGGMYNDLSSPVVTNCIFSNNSTQNSGGGMYNSSSSPVVTNCIFSSNSALKGGGGMFNDRIVISAVTDCTFSGNTTDGFGGGMCNLRSSLTVTNCTFSGNNADDSGGGMYNYDVSLTVTNCTFAGNTAVKNGGGGMYKKLF